MEDEDLLKVKPHKALAMGKGRRKGPKLPKVPKVSLTKKTRKKKV